MAIRKIYIRPGDMLNIHIVENDEELNAKGWFYGANMPSNFLMTATQYRIDIHDPGLNIWINKVPAFSVDHAPLPEK